jgi:predicted nucleic acid-binding protein
MAREEVAFVNASPIIGLAAIDGLGWLRTLYRRALITPTVRWEVLTGLGRAGEAEVAAAIAHRQIGVLRRDPVGTQLLPALDDGAASTIRAALAHGPNALVILDELIARKAARRLGLNCAGTAGVIVEARRARLVKAARPLFQRLAERGFFLAPDLVTAVLKELGEE